MTDLKKQTNTDTTAERPPVDDSASATEALRNKLIDAQTPSYQAEFDLEKVERAGAFVENALSEQAAAESGEDLATALATITGELVPAKSGTELAADLVAEGVDLDELAAELAPYGVDLRAALAAPRDNLPSMEIITGEQLAALLASVDTTKIRIHRASARSLYGWKPGETLYEAIARKKSEEG